MPAEAWQDAHDALSWCYADRLLFKHTNATFSKDDSKDLLEMLDRLKDGARGLATNAPAPHEPSYRELAAAQLVHRLRPPRHL